MRVVLDTNIVVSALLWGGVPFRLLQFGQAGEIELVTSPVLVTELANVLGRSHLTLHIQKQGMSAMQLVNLYQAFAQSVSPQAVPAVIADDPDDDHVLACAVAGHADLIVSGDKHLLGLGGQYQNIPIVKAGEAIRIIGA
jgi:putative PIN family toxin of toxin-antitoxin system